MKLYIPKSGILLPLVCLAIGGGTIEAETTGRKTTLDEYVAKADPNYRYELARTQKEEGFTIHVLDMVSQQWRNEEEVSPNIWRHWLVVVRPEKVRSSSALLFIGGGSNDDAAPARINPVLAEIAMKTGCVVAELRMVPNQPLKFAGDPKPLYEDALIAYTWDKFLRTGDEFWPARLPMTKAAVRAMDTIVSFCGSEQGGEIKIEKFVVAGGSKRGWTTWTTALVDKRVKAIIPLVIDLLNLEPSFRHHFRAYGFYAPAVRDYVQRGIMDWQGTPEFSALARLVEPYEYLERLDLPKFIINSTGDQFFLPDSSRFYYDDLPGVKYIRYVPNTDHSLRNSDAPLTIMTSFDAVAHGRKLPLYDWSFPEEGVVRVTAKDKPLEVLLWQAANPEARDFRLETIGPAWSSRPLTPEADGVYVGRVEKPARGWTAYMIELAFPNPDGPGPFRYSTEVRVIPDVLPFEFPEKQQPKPELQQ
jgi:PhoPQ-activated pathogenicity-related protein